MSLISIYIDLFITFFKIGLFGFGGGYAMLPLIKHEVVDLHKWINVSDFTDIVAISQTTPGPISFNAATYIGYSSIELSGYGFWESFFGASICTFAVSLPSMILMGILTHFFFKFRDNIWVRASLNSLKPIIIGLIASASIMLLNSHNFIDYKSILIFIGAFIGFLLKIDPILLIVLSGITGYVLY